jgi:hypothetical protein
MLKILNMLRDIIKDIAEISRIFSILKRTLVSPYYYRGKGFNPAKSQAEIHRISNKLNIFV